jgi:hypothetical protein
VVSLPHPDGLALGGRQSCPGSDHTWLNGKLAYEIVVKKPFTMAQLALAVRKALGESEV